MNLAERIQVKVRKTAVLPDYSPKDMAPSCSYTESTIRKICTCMGMEHNDIAGRKKSAGKYLEVAKDYEVYVDAKIAEINKRQVFLDSLKQNLEEERMLINALNKSLDKKENWNTKKLNADCIYLFQSIY